VSSSITVPFMITYIELLVETSSQSSTNVTTQGVFEDTTRVQHIVGYWCRLRIGRFGRVSFVLFTVSNASTNCVTSQYRKTEDSYSCEVRGRSVRRGTKPNAGYDTKHEKI